VKNSPKNMPVCGILYALVTLFVFKFGFVESYSRADLKQIFRFGIFVIGMDVFEVIV
jgi:hypothetical protein